MKEKTESTVLLYGVECKVHGEKFPDGRWRDVYRFTVPGWEECSVAGLRETKRVIQGRLDPAVRNTLGIE